MLVIGLITERCINSRNNYWFGAFYYVKLNAEKNSKYCPENGFAIVKPFERC